MNKSFSSLHDLRKSSELGDSTDADAGDTTRPAEHNLERSAHESPSHGSLPSSGGMNACDAPGSNPSALPNETAPASAPSPAPLYAGVDARGHGYEHELARVQAQVRAQEPIAELEGVEPLEEQDQVVGMDENTTSNNATDQISGLTTHPEESASDLVAADQNLTSQKAQEPRTICEFESPAVAFSGPKRDPAEVRSEDQVRVLTARDNSPANGAGQNGIDAADSGGQHDPVQPTPAIDGETDVSRNREPRCDISAPLSKIAAERDLANSETEDHRPSIDTPTPKAPLVTSLGTPPPFVPDTAPKRIRTKLLGPDQIDAARYFNRHPSAFEGKEQSDLKDQIEASGGNIQPIKVRPVGDRYELVSGHRRWMACKALKIKVFALVEELTDEQAMMERIVENGNRLNLSPHEVGLVYLDAQRVYGTNCDLTKIFPAHRSTISKAKNVARLPKVVVDAFACPSQIQYRWATPLHEAVERNSFAVFTLAKELSEMDPRPSGSEVFRRLVGQGIKLNSQQSQAILIPNEHQPRMQWTRGPDGSGNLKFFSGALPIEKEALLFETMQQVLFDKSNDSDSP